MPITPATCPCCGPLGIRSPSIPSRVCSKLLESRLGPYFPDRSPEIAEEVPEVADKFPDRLFMDKDVDELSIATIRALAIDGVQKANSGHPGMPLGAAPMAHVLWTRHLKFDSGSPTWPDRDRFVLSAGHGSCLLYT